VLEFDERLERLSERAGLRSLGIAEPEVDHVDGSAQVVWSRHTTPAPPESGNSRSVS
jgi:hypothetical protein